jgi:hypothetical protein
MHQFHRPIRGPEPSGSNLRQAQYLRDVLRGYQQYYNGTRAHLALAKDSPTRSVQTIDRILPLPILGGLHHRYVRI